MLFVVAQVKEILFHSSEDAWSTSLLEHSTCCMSVQAQALLESECADSAEQLEELLGWSLPQKSEL